MKVIKDFIECFDSVLLDEERKIAYGDDDNDLNFETLKTNCNLDISDSEFFEKAYNYILGFYMIHEFEFCGCGRPYDILKYIKSILNCFITDDDMSFIDHEKYKETFGSRSPLGVDIYGEFILQWLYSVNLTDHSCSIYTSHLTMNGIILKDILNLYYSDDEDEE